MLPDFSARVRPADLPEWMDEPCSYEDFRDCLIDLARVNRVTLAFRPTLDWLGTLPRKDGPLRILDVGCGGGDMLRKIGQWAAQNSVRVELIGIDLNPHAVRAAKEFASAIETIDFISGDAYAYQSVNSIDIVLSSLLTHHLEEEEIIRFIAWMESVAQRGWFVNDLCREPIPYMLFAALSRLAGWHRFVRHDGPVSIRRSFREPDWQLMLAAAGVCGATLQRWRPGRLCVGRTK